MREVPLFAGTTVEIEIHRGQPVLGVGVVLPRRRGFCEELDGKPGRLCLEGQQFTRDAAGLYMVVVSAPHQPVVFAYDSELRPVGGSPTPRGV